MSDMRAGTPLLEVTHLTKHYAMRSGLFGGGRGAVHAVDDVSFTIALGETLGLVGESGCGKSTIARTVLGLTAPTAGAIAWRGERIDRLRAAAMRPYRQALQAVFQDPYASLNPRMRAADIVAEPIRNFETA
jgi:ABC-type glutathione transport system ATPase component